MPSRKNDGSKNASEVSAVLAALTYHLKSPWTVISSFPGCPAEPVEDTEFAEWRQEHFEIHHACTEMTLALEGECFFGLGNRVFRLTPGCCILHSSRDRHDTGRSITPMFRYCGIHFYPGYTFWEVLELRGTEYHSLCMFRMEWAMQWSMHGEIEALRGLPLADSHRLEYLESLCNCLRLRMLATMPSDLLQPPPTLNYRVLVAMRRIDATGGQCHDASELARQAGYSKSHFLRLFREEAGCSFREYVDRARWAAFRDFSNRGYVYKSIAEEIGFSSAVALSHWLKIHRNRLEKLGSTDSAATK